MYKEKNKVAGINKLVNKNVSDMEVSPKFASILMANYYHNGTRILVFCSENTKSLIPNIRVYLADGTFKSCPPPLEQLYTIHGDVDNEGPGTNIVPLFDALMSNRTRHSYSVLFQRMKSKCSEWEPIQPITFKIDFEKAAVFQRLILKGVIITSGSAFGEKGKVSN